MPNYNIIPKARAPIPPELLAQYGQIPEYLFFDFSPVNFKPIESFKPPASTQPTLSELLAALSTSGVSAEDKGGTRADRISEALTAMSFGDLPTASRTFTDPASDAEAGLGGLRNVGGYTPATRTVMGGAGMIAPGIGQAMGLGAGLSKMFDDVGVVGGVPGGVPRNIPQLEPYYDAMRRARIEEQQMRQQVQAAKPKKQNLFDRIMSSASSSLRDLFGLEKAQATPGISTRASNRARDVLAQQATRQRAIIGAGGTTSGAVLSRDRQDSLSASRARAAAAGGGVNVAGQDIGGSIGGSIPDRGDTSRDDEDRDNRGPGHDGGGLGGGSRDYGGPR